MHTAPDKELLHNLRLSALDATSISLGGRRTASVHEFYRYPARFSPQFARSSIEAFTKPGDLVIDPFSGGGTSVVEAQLLGRRSIAADINPLATFVTTAKTTLYGADTLDQLRWLSDEVGTLRVPAVSSLRNEWAEKGYWRNISDAKTWRIRNLLINGIEAVNALTTPDAHLLGKCALLRTGQWALDMRRTVPTVDQFRKQLSQDIQGMAAAATDHRRLVLKAWDKPTQPVIIRDGLPSSADHPLMTANGQPDLILTSPPYPGVYVLYHRWKVRSRRETPAPFWIANSLDGRGINYYTMSARNRDSMRRYFSKLADAFSGIVSLMSSKTWLVQIVGFNGGTSQATQYLDVMKKVGLEELTVPELATSSDGRLWRDVPGRRWWVSAGNKATTAANTSQEVVLIHRLR